MRNFSLAKLISIVDSAKDECSLHSPDIARSHLPLLSREDDKVNAGTPEETGVDHVKQKLANLFPIVPRTHCRVPSALIAIYV